MEQSHDYMADMHMKGMKWLNVFSDERHYCWPEYEAPGAYFTDRVLEAINKVDRLRPNFGAYIDPYFRALHDVADMGVKVFMVSKYGRKRFQFSNMLP